LPLYLKEKKMENYLINPIIEPKDGIAFDLLLTNVDKSTLEIITCPICLNLVWNIVDCGHCGSLFCKYCIDQSISKANNSCPVCRHTPFQTTQSKTIRKIIDKYKLKCPNIPDANPEYADFISHQEKCQFRKYHCKNQSCKEEGYINDMINHTKKCPFRLVECTKCKQNIKFCDIKNHQQEQCPEITIKCKLCGTSMKRGVFLKEHKSDNNDNVKCLKLQVEKWAKTYNDDLNNKILEVNELKNKLKEMDKKKRENEVEINNLKKTLDEIKLFYKNGFNRFFADENINRTNIIAPFDISHEVSKKIEPEKNPKEHLNITESSFYSNKQEKI